MKQSVIPAIKTAAPKPWEQLRKLGGRLIAKPGDSVVNEKDFKAKRSEAQHADFR